MKQNYVMKKLFITITLLLIFTNLISATFTKVAKAQEHRQSVEFVQTFNTIQSELPRERIHLHTDRQWYVFGDRIWFSAYVVAGSYRLPSGISKVLYVELIEPDGTVADRIPIELNSGRGAGSLTFDKAKGMPGNYKIRAYTAWSLNFGDSYEFTTDVMVLTEEGMVTLPTDGDIDLQFMPESGYLVDGLTTNLGFKAVGKDGYGQPVSGVIRDENSDFNIPFSSEHLGMGLIEEFTPDINASYIAEIEGNRYPLPEILESGIILNVRQNDAQYLVDVKSKDANTGDALLLFAHVRGEVFYASLVLLEGGQGVVVIPKEQFSTGVVHFTLLNSEGRPAAERLAYNKSDVDETEIILELEKENFGLRDEVALTLSVKDFESNNLPSKLSLSVFDDNVLEYDQYYTDINSQLNLETEIKGYVENPGYYFSEHENVDRYLDILMLTQGWRAYDMQSVAGLEELNLFSLPETGFTIRGYVKSGFRGRPLYDATVVFSLGAGEEEVQLSTTDEDGLFILDDLQIFGADLINIRANDASGSDRVRIELEEQFSNLPDFSGTIRPVKYEAEQLDKLPENRESISQRAETAQMEIERFVDAQMVGELDEITVTGERVGSDDFERNLRFGERSSQRIDFDENEVLSSIPFLQALNQIPGVTASRGAGLTISTGFTNIGGAPLPEPIIIIDDIEGDFSQLADLSTLDVQTVNVFRRSSELGFFGSRAAGGVITVRTRRGDGGSAANQRGYITARVQGYYPPTQFYSPRYGITVPRDIEQEDTRITLHWDDDVDVPANGRTIRFWTNDIPSTYRIVVQGMTINGLPFSAIKTFSVNQ